jgi:hypothetical protein
MNECASRAERRTSREVGQASLKNNDSRWWKETSERLLYSGHHLVSEPSYNSVDRSDHLRSFGPVSNNSNTYCQYKFPIYETTPDTSASLPRLTRILPALLSRQGHPRSHCHLDQSSNPTAFSQTLLLPRSAKGRSLRACRIPIEASISAQPDNM